MYMDLESDNKKHLFTWKNIEGSEDFILLPLLGFNYEEDDYNTGEYAKVVKHLQKVAPAIRWRTTLDGTDRIGTNPSQWRVICVPIDQFSEAQQLFNRFLDGDDLENYCYTDKYPAVYDKLPDRKSKIKDIILRFYDLLLEYENLLIGKKADISDFLGRLDKILPQMYFYATRLPYVPQAPDVEEPDNESFDLGISLSPYDKFFFILDPYSSRKEVEALHLSALLLSIYEDLKPGLRAFSQNDPDLVAAAVNSWKVGFSIEHGWGRDILTALFVINEIKRKL